MNTCEQRFVNLLTTGAFESISRSQWRELCRGAERHIFQLRLLEAAQGSRMATEGERRALLLAAHAVLPLHGEFLIEAGHLLIRNAQPPYPPVPLEWCDVLIEAMAQQPHLETPFCLEVLNSLRATLSPFLKEAERAALHSPESALCAPTTASFCRARMIARQIRALGLTPIWLRTLLASPSTQL